MTTRTKVGVVAITGAALIGGGLLLGVFYDDDESRPPIIVKNGSIRFDVEKQTWGKDILGEQWKPKQPKGLPVQGFEVSAFGTAQPCAAMMSGTEVVFEYSAAGSEPALLFKLYRGKLFKPGSGGLFKHEPKIEAPRPMTLSQSGNVSTIRHAGQGYLASVEVLNQGTTTRCTFPGPVNGVPHQGRVEIAFQ